MPRILIFAILISLVSFPARADFTICNVSATYAMSVAWGFQVGAIFKSDFNVGGWEHIGPNTCNSMASGDVANSSIWVHAVSNGIILTRGQRTNADRLFDSDQAFCISDNDFTQSGKGVGITESCASDQYLATFPVATWFDNQTTDFTLEMSPDEFAGSMPTTAQARGPKLPDLFGAIAISSTNVYYGSRFWSTGEEARLEAVNYCASREPEALCTLTYDFQNQCFVGASGHDRTFAFVGRPDVAEQEVVDYAMQQCTQAGGGTCEIFISVCSTYAAQSALQAEQDNAMKMEILNLMGGALKALFGQ